MATKVLSLIHLTRGMALMSRVEDPEAQLELLAIYLSTASTLVEARKRPDAMEPILAQAAEVPGEEAAALISDFFVQLGKYNRTLASFSGAPSATTPSETKKPEETSPAST